MALFIDTDVDGSGDIDGEELATVIHDLEMRKWKEMRALRHHYVLHGTIKGLQPELRDSQEEEEEEEQEEEEGEGELKYDQEDEDPHTWSQRTLRYKVSAVAKVLRKELRRHYDEAALKKPLVKPHRLEEAQASMKNGLMQWDIDGNGSLDFHEFAIMAAASDVFEIDLDEEILGEIMQVAVGVNVENGALVKGNSQPLPPRAAFMKQRALAGKR